MTSIHFGKVSDEITKYHIYFNDTNTHTHTRVIYIHTHKNSYCKLKTLLLLFPKPVIWTERTSL